MKAWPSRIEDEEERRSAWKRHWGGRWGVPTPEEWQYACAGELDPNDTALIYEVDDNTESVAAKEVVERLLPQLHSRLAKIIAMRYGIYGVDAMTLEEVAKVFCCTRERIRLQEAQAMRRLRLAAVRLGMTDSRYGNSSWWKDSHPES